jgi:hypothetical protein
MSLMALSSFRLLTVFGSDRWNSGHGGTGRLFGPVANDPERS